ncbi:hypothetical protein [Owenweeksia hongkongensis]|uniref:hypothetical protein n=1 Tax=Owenweeksia hongkongensis TaxID=253245 RepID=UPI003A8CE6D9
MMRHTFLLLAAIFGFSLAAQEGPKITSAVIAADRQDLAEAKSYIDEAGQIIGTKSLSEIRSKDLAKFYYYKGLINFRLTQSTDEAIKALDPDALDKAAEGFKNLIEYEKQIGKERYTDDVKQQLPYLANAYASRGIEASGKEDYANAFIDFQRTYDLKKEFGIGTDTSMLYNAALMAQQAGNNAKAIEITEELISMNYRGLQYKAKNAATGDPVEFGSKKQMELSVKSGAVTDPVIEGDVRPDLYLTAASLNKKEGDTAAYDNWVSKGREMFPENEALLRAELQTFLEKQEYEKALVNLNKAIEKDPSNKLFQYIKGYIIQTETKDLEKARAAYAKAIELDPNYVEPLYMSGLTYVEEANAITEKMNALKLNETSKYNALQKEQNAQFEKALPFFEKAHTVDPKDKDTLSALKEVYYKLKMYEKAKTIQAEIEAL